MAFKKGKGKPKSGNNQNQKRNNTNQKPNGNSGRSHYSSKGTDFKFQLHDSSNKKTYTFEKIREAIILKIQTTYQSGRYVVSLLRNRV